MDLEHILGLAMVLYFVIFSIVDRKNDLPVDDPAREPVPAPPVSTPQTRKADALTRNRIDRIRNRGLGHLLMADYRFSVTLSQQDMGCPGDIRQKLNEMLQEMLLYLNLPAVYTVEVIPDEDKTVAPDRAAECDFSHRRINFFLRSQYGADQLTAMLCHECAHYFCFYHGMHQNRFFMLNEWNTDIVACLIGFSKYMFIPNTVNYLTLEQLKAVRWTLLQERKALAAGQEKETA